MHRVYLIAYAMLEHLLTLMHRIMHRTSSVDCLQDNKVHAYYIIHNGVATSRSRLEVTLAKFN